MGESPYGSLAAFPVPEAILAHRLGEGRPVAATDNTQEIAERCVGDAEKPISPHPYRRHPNSCDRGRGEPLDPRPAGLGTDHENKPVSPRTGDDEFATLLNALSRQD